MAENPCAATHLNHSDGSTIDQPNWKTPMTDSSDDLVETRGAEAKKKPFVEPEISEPEDILENTTFFLAVVSGGTLPARKRRERHNG